MICVALFVYARATRQNKNPYSLAGDLPRGALVYAQFQNLPELINQWQQSQLKERYLSSTNYQQLQHRHLAMKLISRWEEFNSALGFPLDLATIGASTDGAAAFAIYDIGQLDLLFVAPISEEKVALTEFFKSKDQFEELEAPDGTPYYSHTVEADRGRQKQVLAFATVNGRFLLGTNEKLFVRALANIKKRATNDTIAADPNFKTLSAKMNPHFATIWVDQSKLNSDYYFKHYWLMGNVAELKHIRAGIFDLEQQQSKWIERRDFLTTAGRSSSVIAAAELRQLYSHIPVDAPFVKLRSLANDSALPGEIIRDTLFDSAVEQESSSRSWSWDSFSSEDFYPSTGDDYYDAYDRYSYLDDDYDRAIDDPYDARITERVEPGRNPLAAELEQQFLSDLQSVLSAAHASAVAVATTPHASKGPLFVEFRKVAIFNLQSPGNLRRELLEQTIANAAQARLTVVTKGAQPKWENHSGWRSLNLPMLGWEICYAVKDNMLILSNSNELMKTVLESKEKSSVSLTAGIDELTILRFDLRKESFDDIVNVLDADAIKKQQASNPDLKGSQEFFSGNISSLLSVAADVSRVEIKRKSNGNTLHEEIDLVMK
jgi:hypothetical protein